MKKPLCGGKRCADGSVFHRSLFHRHTTVGKNMKYCVWHRQEYRNSKIFLELAHIVGILRVGTIVTGLLKTSNLANLVIFWKNMVKCLVTYVTKCIADVILKTISIKHKFVIYFNLI